MRSSISAARSPWIQGALEPVLPSLALMTCVWLLLLVPALLPEALRPPAVLAAYAVALAVTLALAPRRRRSEAAGASALPLVGLGLAAGLLSYPAWISISLLLGLSLGLPGGSPTPPWPGAPWTWSIALLLAPALEELLYRDRVLPVLSEHWGAAAGTVVTSACFALPHLEPWAVLVCFELGLVAGVLRLAARSVAPCIGLHAGLNLASLAFGVPGFELHPLGPATGALLGSAALLGAVCLARRPLRLRTSARTAIRTSARTAIRTSPR